MKILITGGAGFLGSKLAHALLARNELSGVSLDELVLTDLYSASAEMMKHSSVTQVVGPLIENCSALAKERFDVIFHLAGAVSSACEADLDLGLRSNVDTCRAFLDAIRAEDHRPRFVFASSVAVFGSDPGIPLPAVVQDSTLPTPQSSYGVQKFICEQLVTDYTRKGFIDGRSGRLMTVAIRPGLPNAAASGFLSSIVREPLNNQEAICPVPLDMDVVIASPNATIDGLLKLAEADNSLLGGRTAINFPGLTVSVGGILDALEELHGEAVRARVKLELNPEVIRIVGGWPSIIDSPRALKLGMKSDKDIQSIIRQFASELTASPRSS